MERKEFDKHISELKGVLDCYQGTHIVWNAMYLKVFLVLNIGDYRPDGGFKFGEGGELRFKDVHNAFELFGVDVPGDFTNRYNDFIDPEVVGLRVYDPWSDEDMNELYLHHRLTHHL